MSPLNYIRKVYIGWFVCEECGKRIKEKEFVVDTMAIYCECGYEICMTLYDVKLKIPLEYKDTKGKKINNYP